MEKFTSHSVNYQQFVFTINPEEPLILPSYKGSTLRGGFGYAFKRVVCAIRNKECPDCILKERCVYSYVFETPPPSDTKIMRKYKTVPHPFVIEPPSEKKRGYKPGDEINFGLILIGKAIDCLPYFIYTFDELGKIGIGKGKSKYELKSVSCDGKTIYDSGTKPSRHSAPHRYLFRTVCHCRGNRKIIRGKQSHCRFLPRRGLYTTGISASTLNSTCLSDSSCEGYRFFTIFTAAEILPNGTSGE